MRLTSFGVLALLAAGAGAGGETPQGVAPREMISADQAQSLVHKLEALENRRRAGKQAVRAETVLITEGELNSYLNLGVGVKLPDGVTDVALRLERDRVFAKAMVDLEQVKGKIRTSGPLNPLSLLGGRVPLEIQSRLTNDDGFGTVDVEDVRLGPVSVPLSVLEQMVSYATRSSENPEGFDIRAPFRLPYSVRRIRLQPGRALLEL